MSYPSGASPTRAPSDAGTTTTTVRPGGSADPAAAECPPGDDFLAQSLSAALQRLARRFVAPWLEDASQAGAAAQVGVAFGTALLAISRSFAAATKTPVQQGALYRFLADFFDLALGTRTLILPSATWRRLTPDERALLLRLASGGAPLDDTPREDEHADEQFQCPAALPAALRDAP